MANERYSDINNPVFRAFVKDIAQAVVDNSIKRLEKLSKERWEAEKASCPAAQWSKDGIKNFTSLEDAFNAHMIIHKETEKSDDKTASNKRLIYAVIVTNVVGFVFLAFKGVVYLMWKSQNHVK